MSDLSSKRSKVGLIYSHCLIRLNKSSEYNIMTLASTVFKINFSKNLNALRSKSDLDVM